MKLLYDFGYRFRLVAFLGFLFLQSCKIGDSLAPAGGKYKGTYNGQEVTAQVESKAGKELLITVLPLQNFPKNNLGQLVEPIVFKVNLHLSGNLDIRSNSRKFPNLKFKPVSSNCFDSEKSKSNPERALEFCWGGDEISAFGKISKIERVELKLQLELSEEMPNLEAPAKFKVSDLIARAKTHNFESLVEFQRVLEAKSQTLLAYNSLFPHGNLADGLGVLSLSYLFIIRSVGDLAPFLLPNRWYRAAEAKDQLVAEKQAWIIMDLDGMNITEGLAESARRDSESLLKLRQEKELIKGIRDLVRVRESGGLLQVGASDDLNSLLNQIDLTTAQLETVQLKELSALAHSAGFYNPRAILEVIPEDETSSRNLNSVRSPLQFNFNESLQTALVRSAELRQVLAMVQWAKDNRMERVFTWLDPTSDGTAGLGPGFPSYMDVSFKQIDEMNARKDQLKSVIFNKVSDTLTDLDNAVNDFNLAVQSKEIQERRVTRISQNLKVGINFVMSELVSALQDQVKADIDQITAEYAYLISLSRMNRLLYQGTYAEGSAEDKKGI